MHSWGWPIALGLPQTGLLCISRCGSFGRHPQPLPLCSVSRFGRLLCPFALQAQVFLLLIPQDIERQYPDQAAIFRIVTKV